MDLVLTDTLEGCKRAFRPLQEGCVTMYVCGPTVYNYIHIGNARPLVVFDVLYRLLEMKYKNVIYVRNITDIDDKIIVASLEHGCPPEQIATKYIEAFNSHCAKLGLLEPSYQPKATEHVKDMIEIVESLEKQGYAYVSQKHVLFDVSRAPNYGKLSNRSLESMLSGSRTIQSAYVKRREQDFVLWKPSSKGQPGWDSPWGIGRPGWHLECSAMAAVHLGKTIDIHGGGEDLVFPHHENEIVQSECAYQVAPFVRFWLHNGHVIEGKEKMSKSKGSFVVLKDLFEKFHGESIRLALLSTHYRKPLPWSEALVSLSQATLRKWYSLMATERSIKTPREDEASEAARISRDFSKEWYSALCDDLNIPSALVVLHRMFDVVSSASGGGRSILLGEFICLARSIGLLQTDPIVWLQGGSNGQLPMIDRERVEKLIEIRRLARKQSDFARADQIRDYLGSEGIVLEDSDRETRWRRKYH